MWNEAENRERDYGRVRLARFARIRLLRHALPISLLILREKPTVLQSIKQYIPLMMLFSLWESSLFKDFERSHVEGDARVRSGLMHSLDVQNE